MDWLRAQSTPLDWAARLGRGVIPAFIAWGLLLGVVARAWMRVIAPNPGFTWSGTLAIVLGFAFFAALQSIAALAAERPWRDWPRRGARCLGVVGLLPLFQAAGTAMTPAVLLAGLALWHPQWPKAVRAVMALIVGAFLVAVSWLIYSDLGVSIRTVVGVVGLLVVYAGIVWTAQGTFAPPRGRRPSDRKLNAGHVESSIPADAD